MNSFLSALSLFALFLLPFTIAAQNTGSDESIFGEGAFDQSVNSAKSSQEKLSWQGGVSLYSDNKVYLPVRSGNPAANALFSGKGFLKATQPEVGQFYVSALFNQTLLASSSDAALLAALQAQQPDLYQPQVKLSEAHFSFDIDKKVFLRLGNQLLSWGASRIWQPADFVNLQAYDSQTPVDLRQGKPGLRLHIPLEKANIFFFADFSRSVQNGQIQDFSQSATANARFDVTMGGFNWGLLASGGKNAAAQLGGTLAGKLLTVDVWGEVGSRLAVNGYAQNWASSLGGEKLFGDDKEFAFRTEYYHQDTVKDELWVELADTKLLGSNIGGTLDLQTNLTDSSAQTTATLNFGLPRLVPFSTYVRCNCGPAKSQYIAFAGRTFFTFGIKSLVEL